MKIKRYLYLYPVLLNEILRFFRHELRQEFRRKYALNGILLYIVSTVFISYLCFKSVIHPATWNALFWIILLFASVNAISKSFMGDSRGRHVYYYTLISPRAIILSRILYNMFLMLCISFVSYAFFSLFIGNIVQHQGLFLLVLCLGSMGFSGVLSLVSAIASRTSQNFSLMAILSFPVLIPLLITLIRVSKQAIDGLALSLSYPFLLVLALLNVVVCVLSYVLFPYLWRD